MMLSDGTQTQTQPQTASANDTIDPQALPSGVGFGGRVEGAGVTTLNNETSSSIPAPPGVDISHTETE